MLRRCFWLLPVLCMLAACSKSPSSEHTSLEVLASEEELTITSSKEQTAEFAAKQKGFVSSYDADECYNITPDFIADHSDLIIFKYSKFCESFVLYDGEVYSIGEGFGGFGITSMALADLNTDGQYELYYTFSWGSGLHRSQIGCFDPEDGEVSVLDYEMLSSEMILTVNGEGDLRVSSASLEADSFVDFSIKAEEEIGRIILEEGRAVLKTD